MFKKYSHLPIDLADASLILIAELKGINDIISIDKDYYVYKTLSKKTLNNLFLTYVKK